MWKARVLPLLLMIAVVLTWGACDTRRGKPAGSPCYSHLDCASGLYCHNGLCADLSGDGGVTTDGGMCVSDQQCPSGLVCYEGQCVTIGKEGHTCKANRMCVAPLVCASDGTCQKSGAPGTKGMGEACTTSSTCQKGLVCSPDKKCVPSGSTGVKCSTDKTCKVGLVCSSQGTCAAAGSPGTTALGKDCNVSMECRKGLVCSSTGVCAPAGKTTQGGVCRGTEQCVTGLVCSAGGKCVLPKTKGAAGYGEPCKAGDDCELGLICGLTGNCVRPRFFKGIACEDPGKTAGPFRLFFEVPRNGQEVKEFYRLPFPNDIRKTKDGRLDLSGHPNPGPLLGTDIVGKYISAIEAEVTGFGTNQAVLLRFSKALDWNSVDLNGARPGVIFVDLETGARRSFRISYSSSSGKYICANHLVAQPFGGDPLEHGRTYAVLVMKDIKDQSGMPAQQDKDFEAMLAKDKPTNEDLAAAWTRYEKLRTWLGANLAAGKFPVPADVAGAAVFTTQDPDQGFEKYRQAVRGQPKPVFKSLTLCKGTGTTTPCNASSEQKRACGAVAGEFHELHGKLSLPIFQTGTAPYESSGGGVEWDSSGQPKVARTEDVCFALTVPKGATMPQDGWPVIIYSHGTGGHFRNFIGNGTAAQLASVAIPGGKTQHFAVIGFDQVVHGPRRAGSKRSSEELFFNFLNPLAAKYNTIQAAVDHFSFVRALETTVIKGGISPTGKEIKFDPQRIYFLGHSQGGFVGPLFLAYEPNVRVAVLSGAGGYLIQSLLNKTKPVNISGGIRLALGELQGSVGEGHPLLNLFQLYLEPSDCVNFARLLIKSPLKGHDPKHIYMSQGLTDSYTPAPTTRSLAVAVGVQQARPVLEAKDLEGLKVVDPPVQQNITSGGKRVTAVIVQYKPEGYDGHFVMFRNPDAKRHYSIFLGTAAETGIPVLHR